MFSRSEEHAGVGPHAAARPHCVMWAPPRRLPRLRRASPRGDPVPSGTYHAARKRENTRTHLCFSPLARRPAARSSVHGRARAPPPLPPWACHAGGIVELTLKQICFRAERGSAIRVQSFDDSLNSAIRTTYRISLRSSSSVLTATTLIYAIGAGITAAAGTRLALQLILDKGFKLFSFQLLGLKKSSIVIYCHYLPVSGLGNLRACCLPWMW